MDYADHRGRAVEIFNRLTELIVTDVDLTRDAIKPELTDFFNIRSAADARVKKLNALLADVRNVRSIITRYQLTRWGNKRFTRSA